jgi:FkbM family methyltransferase
MSGARQNWLDSIRWQCDFYLGAAPRKRSDPEFEWAWYSEWLLGGGDAMKLLAKRAIRKLPLVRTRWHEKALNMVDWLETNSGLLWASRALLEDDLSKLLFDMHLVLRATGYERFYFPRIDFEDMLMVDREVPFQTDGFPLDYLGLPLRVYDASLRSSPPQQLKIISTGAQVRLTNSFRQYFVKRGDVEFSPSSGDVVIDCGACIGDLSVVFGGVVGSKGEVHLFDPVPLHARFCDLQRDLNPSLADVLRVNVLAVGDATKAVTGSRSNSQSIAPGGLAIDAFSMTTLDDYAASQNLRRVDLIKMDIEGSERAALSGAASVVREFRPKLTISAYHLSDDLWVLPERIRALSPGYKLYFGHHSPVPLESVFYASHP